jgi:hypothetical protein
MVSRRLASAVDEEDALHRISPLCRYKAAKVLWYPMLFNFW